MEIVHVKSIFYFFLYFYACLKGNVPLESKYDIQDKNLCNYVRHICLLKLFMFND